MIPVLTKNMTEEKQDEILKNTHNLTKEANLYPKIKFTEEEIRELEEMKNIGICKEIIDNK